MSKTIYKNFFAPSATGLGGASVRRAAFTLLMMLLTTMTAWAQGDGTPGNPWISGDCTVTLSGGVLTISGTGAMANYDDEDVPWYEKISDITSVVIESGVTSIGNYAFIECSNLASVSIPATVTSIGEGAFCGCGTSTTALTVTFAEGTSPMTIGDYAFCDAKLKSITIPNRVTSIGVSAFENCSNLASVYVMATTPPALGEYAFESNARGRMIYVPNVGTYTAADGWSSYASAIEAFPVTDSGDCGANGNNCTYTLYGNGMLTISGTGAMANYDEDAPWYFNRDAITSVVIESGVTSIGNHAFYVDYFYLASVSIPASVTSIGECAFFGCSNLASVSIPASVTSIGEYAFSDCSNLETIILNSNPFIGDYAFADIKDGASVTMNLTANSANGAKWMTFYNNKYGFQADANTEVFKVALSVTTLTLNKVADGIVNAGEAVVLKKTTDGNIVMTLTTDASSDTQGNSLTGVYNPDGVEADGNMYVLNYTAANGVGFYKLESGYKVGVGKAYLTYIPGVNGAREFFSFDETSGIEDNNRETITNNRYYDLQGRRLSPLTSHPSPLKKGLYIVNGKKYIKK